MIEFWANSALQSHFNVWKLCVNQSIWIKLFIRFFPHTFSVSTERSVRYVCLYANLIQLVMSWVLSIHTQPWQTLKWCRTDSNNDEPNQFLNLIMVFNFECHNYIYCTPVKIIFISALTFIECERRPFFLFTFPLAHFLLDNDLFS